MGYKRYSYNFTEKKIDKSIKQLEKLKNKIIEEKGKIIVVNCNQENNIDEHLDNRVKEIDFYITYFENLYIWDEKG